MTYGIFLEDQCCTRERIKDFGNDVGLKSNSRLTPLGLFKCLGWEEVKAEIEKGQI